MDFQDLKGKMTKDQLSHHMNQGRLSYLGTVHWICRVKGVKYFGIVSKEGGSTVHTNGCIL